MYGAGKGACIQQPMPRQCPRSPLALVVRIVIICIVSTAVIHPPLRDAEFSSPAEQSLSGGPAIPCLRSEALFGKAREILIQHAGGFYRLRLTHSNKLILTK